MLKKNIVKNLKQRKVYFLPSLPSFQYFCKTCRIDPDSCFIICDQKLKLQIKKWYKNSWIYFVKAGENLKEVQNFPGHCRQIQKIISSRYTSKLLKKKRLSPACFIAIGGGSVTDFAGFFAGIYKRGRPVFYFPSTLLCALDASHGGKTALNVSGVKNALGSYHFPEGVFIVQSLLQKESKKNLISAYGELLKIAFIQGGAFYNKLKEKPQPSFQHIWPLLPPAILAKLKLIKKDPFEKKNIRKKLNLGHSLGHCLEAYHNIPHGQAVAYGTAFAIRWSVEKKLLSLKKAEELLSLLCHYTHLSVLKKIPKHKLKKLISHDKKITNRKMDFIFLQNPGKTVIRPVFISEFIRAYQKHHPLINKFKICQK